MTDRILELELIKSFECVHVGIESHNHAFRLNEHFRYRIDDKMEMSHSIVGLY